MAVVQITVQGKNESRDALTSTARDVDLLDKAVGKLKNTAAALGISFSALKLAEFGKDSALAAARYETIGVAMTQVGKNASYTASQMREYEAGLRSNGIAMIESRQVLSQMAISHMDLAKSQQLGRIAQDAAVIAQVNSSEAFQRMIYAIQSAQPEMLRTLGINVNFEQSYSKLARQLGKNTEELTETEKIQARVNTVMKAGENIAGTYEAAMGTAGKQISSLKRYWEDLKVAIGEGFQKPLAEGVKGATDTLKFVARNFDEIKTAVVGLIEAGAVVYFARLAGSVTPSNNALAANLEAMRRGKLAMTGAKGEAYALAAARAQEAEAAAAAAAANVRLAESEHMAALAAKERAVAWGQSILPGQSRSASAQDIAAANAVIKDSETTLMQAQAARATAEKEATKATTAMTAAKREASAMGRIMTGVTSGLSTAMNALGGPIGLAIIGMTALTEIMLSYAKASAQAAEEKLKFAESRATAKIGDQNAELRKMIRDETTSPEQKAKAERDAKAAQLDTIRKQIAGLDKQIAAERAKGMSTGAVDDYSFLGGGADEARLATLEEQKRLLQFDLEHLPKMQTENEKLKKTLEDIRKAKEATANNEKELLEYYKLQVAETKELTGVFKDLGKTRLEFAGERYNDKLKEEVDLYKQGGRAAEEMVKPLQRYNTEVNAVFNERLAGEKSALEKLGGLYEDYKKKLTSQTKEVKAAGVEILKAYRDTAQGIIATEQGRYKTLLEGERQYASKVKELIELKKQEIKDLKKDFAEADRLFEEKRRTAIGDFSGGYEYLDPSLDPLAKRQAQIERLRRQEEEYKNIQDPAERKAKLLSLIPEWEKLGDAVYLTEKKTRSFADFSKVFSIDGFIQEITETTETVNEVITKEQSMQSVAESRKRIQDEVLRGVEAEKKALGDVLRDTETWKNKLLELDNILQKMTREIVIDLKVNGIEQIQQIQALTGQATSTGLSSGSGSFFDRINSGLRRVTIPETPFLGDVPGAATGGKVVKGGLVRVHDNEDIVPAQIDRSNSGNGNTIHFNMAGLSITVQSTGNAQADADAIAVNLIPAMKKHADRYLSSASK